MTGPEAPRVMADIRRRVVFAGAQGATDLWSEGVVAPAAQYKENLYNRAFARGKTIQPRLRREENAFPPLVAGATTFAPVGSVSLDSQSPKGSL